VAVLCALAALALAGCAEPAVTRIVDGRVETGRYINDAAYALYARAALAEAAGDLGNAQRAFEWAAAEDPDSPEAWTKLAALTPLPDPLGVPARDSAAASSIDAALRRGDLGDARRRSLKARLPSAEIAVRAAALGIEALAHEEAALVLAADPADASARIALAAAADLRGDMPALADALRGIPRRMTPPSPLARWLLADVLRRRVGNEAAIAWLGPQAPDLANDPDPLLAATRKRVRAALAQR
jgi:hypothetical protein